MNQDKPKHTPSERSAIIQAEVARLQGCGMTYEKAFSTVQELPATKAIFAEMRDPSRARKGIEQERQERLEDALVPKHMQIGATMAVK